MISNILQTATKFVTNHSTIILTTVGASGVIATAVFSAKATFHAAEIIRDEQEAINNRPTPGTVQGHQPYKLTFQDKVKLTWTLYLPTAAVALLSCGAIIGANRIGSRQAAAMATAFAISDKAFTDYKAKVVEHLGERKEQRVRDEVIQDKAAATPVPGNVVITTGDKQLCFDAWSGRYFKGSVEEIKAAVNNLNYNLIKSDYASLTDFYNLLGLERTQESDDVGWNNDKLLDIEIGACVSPDGEPALSIQYRVEPKRNYFRLH